MSLSESSELAEVLACVRRWPVADRFELMKRLLETLALPSPNPRGRSVEEILETDRTDKPAPDDETVREWIDEHRAEKSQ
jgi:hypothetical protein